MSNILNFLVRSLHLILKWIVVHKLAHYTVLSLKCHNELYTAKTQNKLIIQTNVVNVIWVYRNPDNQDIRNIGRAFKYKIPVKIVFV